MKIAAKTGPVKKNLDILKKIGFRYVEVYTDKKIIADVEKNAALLSQYDFEYRVHAPTDYFDESAVDFARAIKAKLVITHGVAGSDTLKHLVNYAKQFGIVVCIENGGSYLKPKTIDAFLKSRFDELYLCLDTEHVMILDTISAEDAIKKAGKYIKHIHLTGYPPNFHSPPFENPEEVLKIMKALKSIDYQGFVVAEIALERMNEENFRRTKEFMDDVMKKI